VRACPLQAGAAIVDKSAGFSPGKQIKYSRRNQRSVETLVRKERAKLFSPVMGAIELDRTDGAMNELAEELSLEKRIRQHNNGERELDIHEPVCCGHQFEDGVRMMCLTTMHLAGNAARAVLCGWQVQGHWDTSFGLCDTDFALIGFGMNSMGARFNPVSITIVNSECHEAYEAAFTATKKGLYAAFNLVKDCGVDGCSLCQFIKRHDIRDFKTLRVAQRDALPQKFPVLKPSSDNCAAFIKFAKKKFGVNSAIQQCGIHFTGNLRTLFIFMFLFAVDCVVIVSSHRVEEESLPFQI
jgi:hypothetical protein